ncbi:hypothetical protein Hanom_Chr11g01043011 [Helianthus anomalus]
MGISAYLVSTRKIVSLHVLAQVNNTRTRRSTSILACIQLSAIEKHKHRYGKHRNVRSRSLMHTTS